MRQRPSRCAPHTAPRRAFDPVMLLALACCALCTHPLGAQDAARALVSGVVYDSIARHTMAGASVELVSVSDPSARPFTAVSDASGRYSISGVPVGSYLAGFFHPALDTLGLEAEPRRVTLTRPAERLDLATPSPRSVIAALCPAGSSTDSTGLLIGHVRSTEEQTPVARASVKVEWGETVIDILGLRNRNREVTGESGDEGAFAMCGLPSDAVLQARAFAGRDSSGFVEIEVPANGLRHVTFHIGGASLVSLPSAALAHFPPGNVAWRGRARLSGTVKDAGGNPVANAHALVWGTQLDVTTNDRGEFVIADLPGGTHTLEIRVVGYVPVTTTVQLAESRPATASVILDRKAQILSTVTVRGEMVYASNLVDFNRRRRAGFGQFRTSEEIAQRPRSTKLSQILQSFQNVTVGFENNASVVTMQRNATTVTDLTAIRTRCTPSLYVDGRLDELSDYDRYFSDEIIGIEVYREHDRPFEFVNQRNACGAVVIWTRPAHKPPKKQ